MFLPGGDDMPDDEWERQVAILQEVACVAEPPAERELAALSGVSGCIMTAETSTYRWNTSAAAEAYDAAAPTIHPYYEKVQEQILTFCRLRRKRHSSWWISAAARGGWRSVC